MAETYGFNCDCGYFGHTTSDVDEYYVLCPKCNKKHYAVTCEKCQTGWMLPKDDSKINLNERTWKCEICNHQNNLEPERLERIEVKPGMPK